MDISACRSSRNIYSEVPPLECHPPAWPHRTQPQLGDFRHKLKPHPFYQLNKWLSILKRRIFVNIPIGLKNWIGRPVFFPVLIIQVKIKETWLTKHTPLIE